MANKVCMKVFLLLFVSFELLQEVGSFVIKWNKNLPSTAKGDIRIKHELVAIASSNENMTKFMDKKKKLSNITLNEKCRNGQELSIGFIMYRPYVETIHDIGYLQLNGIIPSLLSKILRHCCPRSEITYGELYSSIRQAEAEYDSDTDLDFTFPLYGLHGTSTMKYKDNPFIPLVEAPRLVLLVPESLFDNRNARTQVLLKTVLNAWPMLIFISVSACLSGLCIWFLDRRKNPNEFPPSFFVGAWEGFWWAFVTMTTVGYGDRSPKSILARIFCIFWILCGIILISLFTGLVTAALSVSTTPVFNIPGAKIGAVSGSKEYQVGVGMNADMRAYDHLHLLMDDLISSKLDGGIIDNFILTSMHKQLESYKLRIEREIPYSVTYGVAMRSKGQEVEKCFRNYIHHYPQKMFETISDKLRPVRNPTDDVRVEVLAAEKLFYEEGGFKLVVYIQTGFLALAVFGGMVWEFFVRNRPAGNYGMFPAGKKEGDDETERIPLEAHNAQVNITTHDLDALIDEYNAFHDKWISTLNSLKTDCLSKGTANGNLENYEKRL